MLNNAHTVQINEDSNTIQTMAFKFSFHFESWRSIIKTIKVEKKIVPKMTVV